MIPMADKFDTTKKDSMATPVTPVEPASFDFARYADFAAVADSVTVISAWPCKPGRILSSISYFSLLKKEDTTTT